MQLHLICGNQFAEALQVRFLDHKLSHEHLHGAGIALQRIVDQVNVLDLGPLEQANCVFHVFDSIVPQVDLDQLIQRWKLLVDLFYFVPAEMQDAQHGELLPA